MQKWIKTLTGLLVIQAILVVLMNANGLTSSNTTKDEILLPFMTNIDKITIQTPNEESVVLLKENNQWVLPDYFKLAVDANKVDDFLAKLEGFTKTWPTATTDSAHKRFEVSDNTHQRKLTFSQGDKSMGSLYLGTSPGYRKTHARVAGEAEVYTISFSNFQANSNAKDWFNRKLFRMDTDNIQTLSSEAFTLTQENQIWKLTDLTEKEKTKTETVQTFVNQLANLSVEEALSETAEESFNQANPTLTLAINKTDGTKLNYTVSLPKDENYYVLKSSSSPLYFKLNKAQGDKLVNTKRSELFEAIPETVSTTPAGEPLENTPIDNAATTTPSS